MCDCLGESEMIRNSVKFIELLSAQWRRPKTLMFRSNCCIARLMQSLMVIIQNLPPLTDFCKTFDQHDSAFSNHLNFVRMEYLGVRKVVVKLCQVYSSFCSCQVIRDSLSLLAFPTNPGLLQEHSFCGKLLHKTLRAKVGCRGINQYQAAPQGGYLLGGKCWVSPTRICGDKLETNT